jgi:hypothetical protein
MSQAEIQRFADDLRSNADLRQAIDSVTSDPLPSVVGIAQRRGYDFTVDEARDFFRARSHAAGRPISEEDLDKVTGGATNPIDAISSGGKAAVSGLESAGKTIAGWFHSL